MNQELLRIVEALARDKNIDTETIFEDLDAAMLSAIRKANNNAEDVVVRIDRETGEIAAALNGQPISPRDVGRIAAQTAKQVLIQRVREAERAASTRNTWTARARSSPGGSRGGKAAA